MQQQRVAFQELIMQQLKHPSTEPPMSPWLHTNADATAESVGLDDDADTVVGVHCCGACHAFVSASVPQCCPLCLGVGS